MIDLDDLEQNLDWHDSRMKNPEHGVIYSLDYNEKDALRELITRLRQAEKDAARYRWIKENSQLGVGKFGFDWELHFCGVAPDNHSLIESHIDEAMKCNK